MKIWIRLHWQWCAHNFSLSLTIKSLRCHFACLISRSLKVARNRFFWQLENSTSITILSWIATSYSFISKVCTQPFIIYYDSLLLSSKRMNQIFLFLRFCFRNVRKFSLQRLTLRDGVMKIKFMWLWKKNYSSSATPTFVRSILNPILLELSNFLPFRHEKEKDWEFEKDPSLDWELQEFNDI